MSRDRAKYEFPIEGIAHHRKADAPAGIFILEGRWVMAAHDSTEEDQLLERGALLVATLAFTLPARPTEVTAVAALSFIWHGQFVAS